MISTRWRVPLPVYGNGQQIRDLAYMWRLRPRAVLRGDHLKSVKPIDRRPDNEREESRCCGGKTICELAGELAPNKLYGAGA
ncbi:hypothetical protein ACLK19_25505 [Escherichia coli]